MTITTLDGLVAAARSKITFRKTTKAADLAGGFCSLWCQGDVPGAAPTPPVGSGEAPTSLNTGAMRIVETGGGIYVGKAFASMATLGTAILYDRLVHTSGLSGIAITEQVINTAALTRYVDGIGVEMFVEHYTATGTSIATLTVKYTNQDGVTGQVTSIDFLASPLPGLMQLIPFAVGDYGVRAVESVTLSTSTGGGAGDFGITLLRRLCEISPDAINNGKIVGPFTLGLPTVQPSACLALMILTSATNTGLMTGSFDILQG